MGEDVGMSQREVERAGVIAEATADGCTRFPAYDRTGSGLGRFPDHCGYREEPSRAGALLP